MKSNSRLALVVASAAAAMLAPSAGAAGFSVSEIAADGRILAVAYRDIDKDGRVDVVVTTGKQDDATKADIRAIAAFANGGKGDFTKAWQVAVPDDVVAFTVGDFLGEGKAQVVYFTPDAVVAMPGAGGAPKRLLESTRFFFNRADRKRLPYWPYALDLNGDGRDDLVFAGPRDYTVYMQDESHALRAAGRVAPDFKFATQEFETIHDDGKGKRKYGRNMEASEGAGGPPPAIVEGSGSEPPSSPIETSRALNRVAFADANADKRLDMIAMKKDKLFVSLQKAEGGYGDAPDLSIPLGPQHFKYAWSDDRLPVSFGDVNGDGRADFLVTQLDAKELTTKLSLYLWGEKGLPAEPDQILKVSGLGDVAPLIDLNGDGLLDLPYLTLRADKMVSIKKPQLEEVDATEFVYLFDAKTGRFSRSPDLKREFTIAVTGERGGERTGDLTNFNGDFNGDGLRDLALFENRGKLQIYALTAAKGNPMKVDLASKPFIEQPIEAPESAETIDLDGDGKSELALRFGGKIQILGAP